MTIIRRIGLLCLAAAAVISTAPSAAAQATPDTVEQADPAVPAILSLRERAKVTDAWLKDRLDTLAPALMRQNKVDMWVLVAREYMEDPVVSSMLDAASLHARRRTILVFFDPGGGRPVERLTVSRYGFAGMFQPSWDPDKQPDQFKRLAEIIAERDPKRIAINTSSLSAFADGMTLSQYNDMTAALPEPLRARIVPSEALAVGWLQTRTPAEARAHPGIVRVAHAIIAEGFSSKVITPGRTTAADVVWWLRERIAELKLSTWFQPSVGIHRRGVADVLEGDEVIQKGDMLWTDFGIMYLGLATDTQHLIYVLRDGESDAPAGLRAGLAAANGVQDALTSSFRAGDTGNAVLARARAKAVAAGLDPTIYSHSLGLAGHGAGSVVGYWDNQGDSPIGGIRIAPDTAWSIELSAAKAVPEWSGQRVSFKLEEDAFFDGKAVRYLDGRQSEFLLIPRATR